MNQRKTMTPLYLNCGRQTAMVRLFFIVVLHQLFEKRTCADQESFVREGPTLTTIFIFILVDEGREDPSTTISGPSSTRQRNAIKWRFLMAFRWRVDDGPTLNAGLLVAIFRGSGPVLLENPMFCDFSEEGVRTPCPPSGSAHVDYIQIVSLLKNAFTYSL